MTSTEWMLVIGLPSLGFLIWWSIKNIDADKIWLTTMLNRQKAADKSEAKAKAAVKAASQATKKAEESIAEADRRKELANAKGPRKFPIGSDPHPTNQGGILFEKRRYPIWHTIIPRF